MGVNNVEQESMMNNIYIHIPAVLARAFMLLCNTFSGFMLQSQCTKLRFMTYPSSNKLYKEEYTFSGL